MIFIHLFLINFWIKSFTEASRNIPKSNHSDLSYYPAIGSSSYHFQSEDFPSYPHPISVQDPAAAKLLIDEQFEEIWRNVLLEINFYWEEWISNQRALNRSTPLVRNDIQSFLMEAIKSDNPTKVFNLIMNNDAKFLSHDISPHSHISSLVPIETAIFLNSYQVLNVMLKALNPVTSNSKPIFLGGLLIRAVQAGHFEVISLLIKKFNAPYLAKSFLFQQAIMNKTSSKVLRFIYNRYKNKPEISGAYGTNQDFAIHLAVKNHNDCALNFILSETDLDKNLWNGDKLLAIDLVFLGKHDYFLQKLIRNHPQIRYSWIDTNGNNLVHLSVLNDRFNLLKFLVVDLKFPADGLNSQGQSALLLALATHRHKYADLLVNCGASIFQSDLSGIYPILLLARQFDSDTFISVLDFYKYFSDNLSNFYSLIQSLINEENWEFVNILLGRFPQLAQSSLVIPVNIFKNLFQNVSYLNLKYLVEYLVKCNLIDLESIFFDGICSGKEELVRLAISYGVPPNLMTSSGESGLLLAITNKRTDIVRLLLSFGVGIIMDSYSNYDFVYLLTSGASFFPASSSAISFESIEGILDHFIVYFEIIGSTKQFNMQTLATICIQLEIFLHQYLNGLINENIILALKTLTNTRKSVSTLVFNDLENHQVLKALMNPILANQVNPLHLYPIIDYRNYYLIFEYRSILNLDY